MHFTVQITLQRQNYITNSTIGYEKITRSTKYSNHENVPSRAKTLNSVMKTKQGNDSNEI